MIEAGLGQDPHSDSAIHPYTASMQVPVSAPTLLPMPHGHLTVSLMRCASPKHRKYCMLCHSGAGFQTDCHVRLHEEGLTHDQESFVHE